MNPMFGLVPMMAGATTAVSGSGVGLAIAASTGVAAAYGVAKKPWKKRLHVVERDNLESELEDLDIEPVEECSECGEEIQPEEIGAVVRQDGEYKIVCDKSQCLDSV